MRVRRLGLLPLALLLHLLRPSASLSLAPLGSHLALSVLGTALLTNGPDLSALEQVVRVRLSLDSVTETINGGSDSRQVVAQVRGLLNNYRLRDNSLAAAALVSGGRAEEARTHASAAVEDLALVSEYFEEETDNLSGSKRLPREALQFGARAVDAAERELDQLLGLLPRDVRSEVEERVRAEFN